MRTFSLGLQPVSPDSQAQVWRASTDFWQRLTCFNVRTRLCPLQASVCNCSVVQVIDAQKRDIVSIRWTQGALSSDWLGQPPLTCPWPIRGECAVCESVC